MTAWSLSDDSIEKLVNLPETGMGFQLVSASWRGESAVLIVLNAELAFDLWLAFEGGYTDYATVVEHER